MKVNKIKKINDRTYILIIESESGITYETVCRVHYKPGSDNSQRPFVTFDSDDFQRAIMLGHILAKDASAFVLNFHKQL